MSRQTDGGEERRELRCSRERRHNSAPLLALSLAHFTAAMALRSRHAAWRACTAARELAWGGRHFSTGDSPPPASSGFRLLDIFSAARRRQRVALHADMQRGYFDDIRGATVKELAPLHLLPAAQALPLPAVPVVDAAGAAAHVGLPGVACVVFRAGAARSVATWTPAVSQLLHTHGGQLQYTQLSVVDTWLYTLPGLRSLLLRSGKEAPLSGGLGTHAFVFGGQHSDLLRRQVGMPNRLLAHVLLLDAKGRVRWKASGDAAPEEVDALPRLVADMLTDE